MTGQSIAQKLRNDILTGILTPGTQLQQTDIAEKFNVSRIPVRDALGILSAENLIIINPNRHARVVRLSTDELVEIYDLRVLLECNCMSRALKNLTESDIDTIEYELEKSNLEAGRSGWAEGDWAFHKALYAPSKRSKQIEIIADLRQTCQIHTAAYDSLIENTQNWLEDHKNLVNLYKQGDASEAKACLRAHLNAAKEHLISVMKKQDQTE